MSSNSLNKLFIVKRSLVYHFQSSVFYIKHYYVCSTKATFSESCVNYIMNGIKGMIGNDYGDPLINKFCVIMQSRIS